MNNILNFKLRLKRYYNEYVLESKFIKYFKKNKLKCFIGVFLLIFFLILIYFGLLKLIDYNNFNKQLIGPKTNNLILNSGNFKMSYSGDINNSKIYGNGTLIITTNDYIITLDGFFDELQNNNKEIEIGNFVQGKIILKDNINNISYIWDGKFETGNLKDGTLKIKDNLNNRSVTYEGFFQNGKLEGSGKKTIEIGRAHV